MRVDREFETRPTRFDIKPTAIDHSLILPLSFSLFFLLSHPLIILLMQSVLLTHKLLNHASMDFPLHFVDYNIEVVFVLQLQFLVMRATLIGRPFLENLGEAIEDLSLSSGLF